MRKFILFFSPVSCVLIAYCCPIIFYVSLRMLDLAEYASPIYYKR